MKKTLLLLAIASLSTQSMAQQEGSKPDPFNNEPLVKNNDNNRQDRQNRQDRLLERELERQERTPKSGADVLTQSSQDVMDRSDLPKPVDLPDLPEIPNPQTVDDLYRGAEDFRVKGTINSANIEYSQQNNVYRITGSTFKEVEKDNKDLTVKRKNNKEGGKESLPKELQQGQGE